VIRTILLTAFALVAFAFNSILCRLALRGDEADAAGFTAVRLISGALTLVAISLFFSSVSRASRGGRSNKSTLWKSGSWLSALWLAAYAIFFSFAYLNLSAGTGALILFGSVQLTMFLISLGKGERPRALEWLGLIVALGGLVYLVLPGLASPPLNSSLLMAAAGASWGLYTLRGKGSNDPLADTTGNFVRTIPFVIALAVVFFLNIHLTNRGIILAVLSGAVASGIGYTVWYAALKYHTAARAGVLQLAVPVIAAAGGVLFMAEGFTSRLIIAGILILGGIGLTMVKK
jgi:drug/metabolite transporter (DMT)-like permease